MCICDGTPFGKATTSGSDTERKTTTTMDGGGSVMKPVMGSKEEEGKTWLRNEGMREG